MSDKMYEGNRPSRDKFMYMTSITNSDRKWDVYVSDISNEDYLTWKFVLSSGKSRKANYWLHYSIQEGRIRDSQKKSDFLRDFPASILKYIEDVSKNIYLSFHPWKKEESTLSETEHFFIPMDLLLGKPDFDVSFFDTKGWSVKISKEEKCIVWERMKKTNMPLHPDWDDISFGLPSYDYITLVYYIDEDALELTSPEDVFLRYFPSHYFYCIKFFSQYLAFKFRHYFED